jgi:hypothetical protein
MMVHVSSPGGAIATDLAAPRAVGIVDALDLPAGPYFATLNAWAAKAWLAFPGDEFSRRTIVATFSPAFCARGSVMPVASRSGGPQMRSLATWFPSRARFRVASVMVVSVFLR